MAEAPRIKQTVRIDLKGIKKMERMVEQLGLATAEVRQLAVAMNTAKNNGKELAKVMGTLSINSSAMSKKVAGMMIRLTNLMERLAVTSGLTAGAFNNIGGIASQASAQAQQAGRVIAPKPTGDGKPSRSRRRSPWSISFSGLFLNPRFGAALTGWIAGLATAFYTLRRAIQGILIPSVKFEQGMAHVSRTTKIVGDELKLLTDRMSEVAAATGVTHDNIAKIGVVAGQLGVKGVDNVTEFVRTVAMMERVTDLTAEKAATGLAKVAQAFSLPISKAENIGSTINELANNTTAAASEIVQALGKLGPVAANLNIPLSTTAAMLTTLIDTGLVAPRAGTNLRNLLILVQAKSSKIARLMNTPVQEFTDNLEENAESTLRDYFDELNQLSGESFAKHIKEVFGQENFAALDTLVTLYHEFADANELATKAFREKMSMVDEYTRMMNTVQGQWDLLKATVSDIAVMLGQSILPMLNKMLRAISFQLSGSEVNILKLPQLTPEQQGQAITMEIQELLELRESGVYETAERAELVFENLKRNIEDLRNDPNMLELPELLALIPVQFHNSISDVDDAIKWISKRSEMFYNRTADLRKKIDAEQADVVRRSKGLSQEELRSVNFTSFSNNRKDLERIREYRLEIQRIAEEMDFPLSELTDDQLRVFELLNVHLQDLETVEAQWIEASNAVSDYESRISTLLSEANKEDGLIDKIFDFARVFKDAENSGEVQKALNNFIKSISEDAKIPVEVLLVMEKLFTKENADVLYNDLMRVQEVSAVDDISESMTKPKFKAEVSLLIDEIESDPQRLNELVQGFIDENQEQLPIKKFEQLKAANYDLYDLLQLIIKSYKAMNEEAESLLGTQRFLNEVEQKKFKRLSDTIDKDYAGSVLGESRVIATANRRIETMVARMTELQALRNDLGTGEVIVFGEKIDLETQFDSMLSKLLAIKAHQEEIVAIEKQRIALVNTAIQGLTIMSEKVKEQGEIDIKTDVSDFLDVDDLELREEMQDMFDREIDGFIDPEKFRKVVLKLEDFVEGQDGADELPDSVKDMRATLIEALDFTDSNITNLYSQHNLNVISDLHQKLISSFLDAYENRINEAAERLMDSNKTLTEAMAIDIATSEFSEDDFFRGIQEGLGLDFDFREIKGDPEKLREEILKLYEVRAKLKDMEEIHIKLEVDTNLELLEEIKELFDDIISNIEQTVDQLNSVFTSIEKLGDVFGALPSEFKDFAGGIKDFISSLGSLKIMMLEMQQFRGSSRIVAENVMTLDPVIKRKETERQDVFSDLEVLNEQLKVLKEQKETGDDSKALQNKMVENQQKQEALAEKANELTKEIDTYSSLAGEVTGVDHSPFQQFLGQLNTAIAGIALAKGAIDFIGGLFNAANRRREEMMRIAIENRKRMVKAIESLETQTIKGQDITGEQARALSSRSSQILSDIEYLRSLGPVTNQQDADLAKPAFNRLKEGIKIMNELLESMGLELIPELESWGDFGLNFESIEAYMQSIVDTLSDHGAFGDTVDGVISGIEFLGRFLEIDAVRSFQLFLDKINEMEDIPDWFREQLSGIDLTTAEGQEQMRALLVSWAEQFQSGDISLDDFGGITPEEFQDMMQFLFSTVEQAQEDSGITTIGIDRTITDVQANQVIALLEQQVYYTKEMHKIMKGDGPPVDIGSVADTAAPVNPQQNSNYAVNFNGDIVMDVPYDPDDPAFAKAAGEALREHLLKYQGRSR